MSLSEIRREVSLELPIVMRKADYICEKLRREVILKHKDKITIFPDYLSKHKNKWMLQCESTKKAAIKSFMLYYYNTTGLVGIAPIRENDYLIFHTTHFFKRLNERLHLELTQPNDIIRAYLEQVDTYNIGELDYFSPGLCNIFVAAQQGYFLGTADHVQRFFKFNTFLRHEYAQGRLAKKRWLTFAGRTCQI